MLLSAVVLALGFSAPLISGPVPTDRCLEVFPGVATPEIPMRRAETWTLWAQQADHPVRFHRQAAKLYECAIEKAKAQQKSKEVDHEVYAAIQDRAEHALRQAKVRVENNWDTFRSQYPAVWWFLDENPTIERYEDADMAAVGQAWNGLIDGLEPLKIPRLTVLPRCLEVAEISIGHNKASMCALLRGELLQVLSQSPRFQGIDDGRAVEVLGADFPDLVTDPKDPGSEEERALVRRLAAGLGIGEVMLLDLHLSDRFHLPANHQWADVARIDLNYRVWSERKQAWIADGRRGAVVANVSTGWWIGFIAIALLFMFSVLFATVASWLRRNLDRLKAGKGVRLDKAKSLDEHWAKALFLYFGIPLLGFIVGGGLGVLAGMLSEQFVPSWGTPALTPVALPRVHVLWWPFIHGFVVMVLPTLLSVALIFRFLDDDTRRNYQIEPAHIVASTQGGALGALYWPVITASWMVPGSAAFWLAFASPIFLSLISLYICRTIGSYVGHWMDPSREVHLPRQMIALLLGLLLLCLLLPVGLFLGGGLEESWPTGLIAVVVLTGLLEVTFRRLIPKDVRDSLERIKRPAAADLGRGDRIPWVSTPLDGQLRQVLRSVGVSSLTRSDPREAQEKVELRPLEGWGAGRVYRLSGHSGFGKTRQLSELSKALQGRPSEIRVGQGAGTLALNNQPYGLLAEAWRSLGLVDLESRLRGLKRVEQIRASTSDVLQASGTMGGLLAGSAPVASDNALASAMIDEMEKTLLRQPVVLLFDDYQHADENSDELLRRIVNGLPAELAQKLVVLFFYEFEETDKGDVLETFLLNPTQARQLLKSANINIEGRSNDQNIEHFLTATRGDSALYRAGYIVDGLRTLDELGFLQPDRSKPGLLHLKRLDPQELALVQPKAVINRYHDQFRQLTPQEQQVLYCGSLCGVTFSVDVVAWGLQSQPLEVLQCLRDIEVKHRLVDDDDDDTTFRFVSNGFRRFLESEKLKKEQPELGGTEGRGQRPWRELAKQMHYNIAQGLEAALDDRSKRSTEPAGESTASEAEPDPMTSSLIAYHAHQAGTRLRKLASVHLAWGVVQAADSFSWAMAQRKADRFSRRQNWPFDERREQARTDWEQKLDARDWPPGFEKGEEGEKLRWRLDFALAQANSRQGGNRRVLARALLRRLVLQLPETMDPLRRQALILYLHVSYTERQVSELDEIKEDAQEWLGEGTKDDGGAQLRAWLQEDPLSREILLFFQIRAEAFLAIRQCRREQLIDQLKDSLRRYGELTYLRKERDEKADQERDEAEPQLRRHRLWGRAEILVAEAETQFKLGKQEAAGDIDYNGKRFLHFEEQLKDALKCQLESGNLVDAARNHLSRANLLIEKIKGAGQNEGNRQDSSRTELDQCLDAVDELIRKTGAEKLRSRLENLRATVLWQDQNHPDAFKAANEALEAACATNTARDIFYAAGNLFRFAEERVKAHDGSLRSELEALTAKEASPIARLCHWSVWRELPDGDDLRQKFLAIHQRQDQLEGDSYLIGEEANGARPGYLALKGTDAKTPYGRFCRRVLAAQIRAYRGRGGQENRERIRFLSNYLIENTLRDDIFANEQDEDPYLYDALRANLRETFEEKQADELLAMLQKTKQWHERLTMFETTSPMGNLCLEVVQLYAALALNFLQSDEKETRGCRYRRLVNQGDRLLRQWKKESLGGWTGEKAVMPHEDTETKTFEDVRRHRRLLSRVLRETVLILERFDSAQDDWVEEVRSWLQAAVDHGHLPKNGGEDVSSLDATALRSRLLDYAEVLAGSGRAAVAVAEINIQRADQRIWKLQARPDGEATGDEADAHETRELIRTAYEAYERAGEVLERNRYESFRSKLRNTFANISWREAMTLSEQDQLGRSADLLDAYDRAQRAYDMACEWERERDLIYAAITLLRFRRDYGDGKSLFKAEDQEKFEERWKKTVNSFQGKAPSERSEEETVLSSESIWCEVVPKDDHLSGDLKKKMDEAGCASYSWSKEIKKSIEAGRDLQTMIEETPGAEEAMRYWSDALD